MGGGAVDGRREDGVSGRIRVLSVAVPRDGDRVLVERGSDSVTGERYYRAIGGGVEFGERAADAVAREWIEEFGLGLQDVEPLGVLESLFTYEGAPGHEIVFVHAARVADEDVFPGDEFVCIEPDGLRHEAVWVPLGELTAGEMPLHPDGVLDLILRP